MSQRWKNHIQAWRQAANMTLQELGDAIEPPIAKGQLSHYESGQRKPRQDRLAAIAKALGCEPGQLIDGPPGRAVPAEVIDIWSRIPRDRHPQAIKVLKTFEAG